MLQTMPAQQSIPQEGTRCLASRLALDKGGDLELCLLLKEQENCQFTARTQKGNPQVTPETTRIKKKAKPFPGDALETR